MGLFSSHHRVVRGEHQATEIGEEQVLDAVLLAEGF